jgi:TRAP-type C4-dicarboxylate transport system permease large subunit
LPVLIQQGYKKDFSSGLVASTGTLGQIIPPSIALVLLGDVMSNAYQRAQNNMGIFSQQTVTVGDLFIGAIVPGIMICLGYLIYTIYQNYKNPNILFEPEANSASFKDILKTLALPLLLIILGFRFYYCWNSDSNRGICYWCCWCTFNSSYQRQVIFRLYKRN